ncbi:MAG: type II toxin-antitoxin system VapC family toxin [Fimbriimonas sp.]
MGLTLVQLRVYLDTDGLLDLVPSEGNVDDKSENIIIRALARGALVFVTSELTILEALVHARRSGDQLRQSSLRRLLTPSPFIETRPVSLEIIEDALDLRVLHGLKSPDAIHIATGLAAECSAYLTKDEKWSRLGLTTISVSQLTDQLREL